MQLSIYLVVYQQSTQQSKRCITNRFGNGVLKMKKLAGLDGGMGVSFCTNEMNDLPDKDLFSDELR